MCGKERSPAATLQLCRNEETFVLAARATGQYDAFINALRSVCPEMPELVDYRIGISRKGDERSSDRGDHHLAQRRQSFSRLARWTPISLLRR